MYVDIDASVSRFIPFGRARVLETRDRRVMIGGVWVWARFGSTDRPRSRALDGGRAMTTVTRAVDVVARTLALAAEARGPGERKRARALFESALKQYVAELDEMRAMVERAGAGLRLEEDAGKDGMETN